MDNKKSEMTKNESLSQPMGPTESPSENNNKSALQQYLSQIVGYFCRLSNAQQGVILKSSPDNSVQVLALSPETGSVDAKSPWLVQSARLYSEVTSSKNTRMEPLPQSGDLYGQPVRCHLVLSPFEITELGSLLAVFLIEAKDPRHLEAVSKHIHFGLQILSFSEQRPRQLVNQETLHRVTRAISAIDIINQQGTFTAAAMAFCNEIAVQWKCERVSLGFLSGQYIQIKAMNHTEEFYRKMGLIRDIESAMEECLDQDTEIIVPSPKEATYICKSAQNLSDRGNPRTILSLPLRRQGKAFAVLTLERIIENPFTPDQIEALRLSCALCSARLEDLYQHDRWIGSILADKVKMLYANILQPTHTWAKVAVVTIFLALLFLIFAKGEFRPDASFVFETTSQQIIPAPFDGYLETVKVEVGQTIEPDSTVLATLDTTELRLQLAAAQADRVGYLKQFAAAMRDNETAQAQIAQANADKAQAQIDLLNHQISQAQLTTSLEGVVVKGDLKKQIGAPVKTGDVLFEICPLESIRAQLLVPDDLILFLKVGQEGYLATASYPEKSIPFVIERIDPMAEVVNQRNVFKVRARLSETYPWMRPGMEGVAKVSVGKKRYVWIWTRKLTTWLRMKLWL